MACFISKVEFCFVETPWESSFSVQTRGKGVSSGCQKAVCHICEQGSGSTSTGVEASSVAL